MNARRSLWVAAAIALLPSGVRAQDRGVEILHETADRYGSVETLCADFTQHLLVPLLGTERTGAGRLCQTAPNLFAMRFDDPEGDLIVVDGSFAWVYFPSNDAKTVLKTSADESAGGRDFHREFLEEPESKYEVTYEGAEDIDGWTTYKLRMTPKRPMSYRVATVWIDQGEPVLRRLQMEEANGNIRTITLDDVGFGVDPGAEYFTFSPPDGALVVVR
ncbi:MAG: outer membrane lipoprotein carrier protein LolA [Gemmatimonadota bacterium]|nr:outer membrane lipoprotein carrier protein LolA [Gemmatimonadota bacterium]MDE3006795.1 outer membrane lipoprotein carrier protein LolA [Gemmatimonadota bacterium]MDE3014322.1 outer membrane lipoprotein carrier protein LolA [Gemmatimonadota bacterium]